MKIFYALMVLAVVSGCAETAGLSHPDESKTSKKIEKTARKAAPLECEATISSSGESNGLLRCSDAMCQSENPVGTVRKFDCKKETVGDEVVDVCPVKANTRYNRVCNGLHFNSGCSVWYSPVTRCR